MEIVVHSFGYKHGYFEADVVLDVRFLPNPYWVPELKAGSGCDPEVALYVLNSEKGHLFLPRLEAFLQFLIEQHQQKDRAQFTIAIGCTGGRHRSVAVTEHLRRFLMSSGFTTRAHHRDIDKN